MRVGLSDSVLHVCSCSVGDFGAPTRVSMAAESVAVAVAAVVVVAAAAVVVVA